MIVNLFLSKNADSEIKRITQKYALNDLSKELLSGKVHNDQTIVVDVDENKLIFREK